MLANKNDLRMDRDVAQNMRCFMVSNHTEVAVNCSPSDAVKKPSTSGFRFQRMTHSGSGSERSLKKIILPKSSSGKSISSTAQHWTSCIAAEEIDPLTRCPC